MFPASSGRPGRFAVNEKANQLITSRKTIGAPCAAMKKPAGKTEKGELVEQVGKQVNDEPEHGQDKEAETLSSDRARGHQAYLPALMWRPPRSPQAPQRPALGELDDSSDV